MAPPKAGGSGHAGGPQEEPGPGASASGLSVPTELPQSLRPRGARRRLLPVHGWAAAQLCLPWAPTPGPHTQGREDGSSKGKLQQ